MNRPAKITLVLFCLAGAALLGWLVTMAWPRPGESITGWYAVLADPERVEEILRGWGPIGAPLAFIGVQVLQVVFAPIPGEASGFAGGYLFGALPGFAYSTIGLTGGSIINFMVGRALGRRYVAKWIPADHLARFDTLAKRQGTVLFFILFVLPGFPKDYLCIFLGLTSLSATVFVQMTFVGRMPGTLMLSLQGARVFEQDYVTLALLVAVTLVFAVPVWVWRERVYEGIARLNRAGGRRDRR